jgi:ATP-dependent protease ClpP protease subunit
MPSNTTQTGPWWQIKALATTPEAPSAAEIHIYSDIGESWDDSTIAARTFVEAIAALSVDTLTVRINSFGGSVPDGLAIFNALRRHPATVAVEIDGIAASIASLIAMAGDSVSMAANALLMVHAPWASAIGNAQTLRSAADTLDHFANAMSAAYARPGFSREDALALLTDGQDHWYTADEALATGLIDAITPALAIAASVPDRFRFVAAATQPPEASMPIPVTPAATEQQPAVNLADITAKAAADARAALAARTATLKTRFEAFSRAHPSRVDEIRAVFDVALTDLDQTPEQFTDAVLAKFAETPDEPIAGAHTTRASIGEDQRDKLIHACTDALLIRAAVPLAQRPDLNGNPFKGKTLARIAEDALTRNGVCQVP